MEETKPAHVKSSLSLALRNRPVGAQTGDEMRMLGGEPELPAGGNHSPGGRGKETSGVNLPDLCVLRQILNLSVPPFCYYKRGWW